MVVLFSMLSNFRILIEMRNRSFVFFYSGLFVLLFCSVGLAIIHKVAIVATDFVNDSVSLFRWRFILWFGKLLGKGSGGFITHFNIFSP